MQKTSTRMSASLYYCLRVPPIQPSPQSLSKLSSIDELLKLYCFWLLVIIILSYTLVPEIAENCYFNFNWEDLIYLPYKGIRMVLILMTIQKSLFLKREKSKKDYITIIEQRCKYIAKIILWILERKKIKSW